VSLKKKCVDCITSITSTNKTVHQLLSRIICVLVIIEPTLHRLHPSSSNTYKGTALLVPASHLQFLYAVNLSSPQTVCNKRRGKFE
jgi:hypothetical protein